MSVSDASTPFAKPKLTLFSLRIQLPRTICLFCLILSTINGFFGYRQFRTVFEEMYNRITIQFAYTAASYINGDKVSHWLENGADDEWEETTKKLNHLTNIADLVFIYLFVPSDDYKTRTYVFDTINASATNYKVIPLGYTESLEKKNEEYIANVKRLMMTGKRYTYYTYNKTGGHVTSAIPLYDSYNNIVGILSVIKPMSEV